MQFVTGMVGAKPIFLMQVNSTSKHPRGSVALDRKIAILSNFVHGGNLQDLILTSFTKVINTTACLGILIL